MKTDIEKLQDFLDNQLELARLRKELRVATGGNFLKQTIKTLCIAMVLFTIAMHPAHAGNWQLTNVGGVGLDSTGLQWTNSTALPASNGSHLTGAPGATLTTSGWYLIYYKWVGGGSPGTGMSTLVVVTQEEQYATNGLVYWLDGYGFGYNQHNTSGCPVYATPYQEADGWHIKFIGPQQLSRAVGQNNGDPVSASLTCTIDVAYGPY